jgi:hypothetical protein
VIPTDAALRTLQVVGRDGRGLLVTWFQDDDRYGHEIAVVSGSKATVCLIAETGRDRDPWPASPPLQQYSLEASPLGRPTALFIGMAGKSHWSQSIETDDSATAALTFDVACRVHRPPSWLGSTYRTNRAAQVLSASSVRLAVAEGVDVTVTALTGQASDHSFPGPIEVDGSQLAIAADSAKLRLPATVRWRYRIALDTASAAQHGLTF